MIGQILGQMEREECTETPSWWSGAAIRYAVLIPVLPRFSSRHALFFGPDDSWHDQGQKIPYKTVLERVRQPRRSSAWSTDARTQGKIWARASSFHLPKERCPTSRSAAPMHGCGDAGSVPRYLRPLPVVARTLPSLPQPFPTPAAGIGRLPQSTSKPHPANPLIPAALRLSRPQVVRQSHNGAAKTSRLWRPDHEAWADRQDIIVWDDQDISRLGAMHQGLGHPRQRRLGRPSVGTA